MRQTERQLRGAWAELAVATHLQELGWSILARNVRVGRDEIDLLAVEPGVAATLVVVEVRSLQVRGFGAPEERVDAAKVGRLYRAAAALRRLAQLPSGEPLPRLPWRVDLVIVDVRSGLRELRHLRALEPP